MRKKNSLVEKLPIIGIMFISGCVLSLNAAELSFAADNKLNLRSNPPVKEVTPSLQKSSRPVSRLIRISGSVRQPGGKGIGKARVKLYEWIDGGFVYAREVSCKKKTGAYSISLDKNWLNKGVKLVPQLGALAEGEHFVPHEKLLNVDSYTITNVNFLYPHEYMPLDE